MSAQDFSWPLTGVIACAMGWELFTVVEGIEQLVTSVNELQCMWPLHAVCL